MIRKLLLVCVFMVLLVPTKVIAQEKKGIGITPAIQELKIDSNQSSTGFDLYISNTNEQAVNLKLSTMDFGALDESGGVAFLGKTGQETTVYGLSNWLVLEKDSLSLEPGQSQTVKITVNNREDLSPGGHYGAVIVSADTGTASQQNNLSFVPAASTLVLLKKTGGEKQELKLESQKTNSSWLRLPDSVDLRFQNTGNVHVVPRGTVELFSPSGTLLSREIINEESGFVLPESFRQFKVSFTNQKQPWLPGKYKIVTTWRHSDTEEFKTNEISVWYVGKLVIWLVIILSLLIVLIMYVNYRKKPVTRGR